MRLRLDDHMVAAARLPAQRRDEDVVSYRKRWEWLGDIEVPGFGVKLYGNGSRVFALRYRTDYGRSRMLRLGLSTEMSVADARALAKAAKLRIFNGGDPVSDKNGESVAVVSVVGSNDGGVEGRTTRLFIQLKGRHTAESVMDALKNLVGR